MIIRLKCEQMKKAIPDIAFFVLPGQQIVLSAPRTAASAAG